MNRNFGRGFIGTPAAAALVCLFLVAAGRPQAQEVAPGGDPGRPPRGRFYASNELAMPLQPIGWYRREEFAYTLMVEQRGGVEIRTLLHEGRELRRYERKQGQESVFEGGELVRRVRTDGLGRVVEEQLFAAGQPAERTTYLYGPGGLASSETFDAAGRLLYRDRYALSSRGMLRRVDRRAADGRVLEDLAVSGSVGAVAEKRYGVPGDRRVERYDGQGRLIERERWLAGALSERESFFYRQGAAVPDSSELLLPAEGREVVRAYDEEGRLTTETVQEGGAVVESTEHLRDAEGRIVETTRRGRQGPEQWRFVYDAEGQLEREEYRRRGALERVTLYSSEPAGPARVEELYRDGELFFRVFYRGEQKLREEFVRSGQVVRVREFE